jgi:2-methylcitrate dehydratase PrpD
MILLQTIGVSLAAKGAPEAQKALNLALRANHGSGGPTTAWATGEKLSAAASALLAGNLADLLDWEDCSWTGHPSAAIIPVAWITAEEKGKSGKDVLTAIVTAYEVYQRIALAAQPGPEMRKIGWGLTSWQLFGASIAAAKIYGLDARQVDQTIGLSVESSTITAGYHNTTFSDVYHYEHGYRARSGVLIAKIAEKGIHNQRDTLDAPRGYLDLISDTPDRTWLKRGLGTEWLILETLLKHWPANMWVQTPLEALNAIVTKHPFQPADVVKIVVDPGFNGRFWKPWTGFDSITQAEFSIPFVLSAYLHDPVPGAQWYTPENLHNPSVISLAQKIYEGPTPEAAVKAFALFRLGGDYQEHTVTVTLRDGSEYSATANKHLGHPHNMLTEEQFVERFRVQAAPVLQGKRLEDAIRVLTHIEDTENIADVSWLLHDGK